MSKITVQKLVLFSIAILFLFSCGPKMSNDGIKYANKFRREFGCYEILWGIRYGHIFDSISNTENKFKFLKIQIVRCIKLPDDSIKSANYFVNSLAEKFFNHCENKNEYDGIVLVFKDDVDAGDERHFYYLLNKNKKLHFVKYEFYDM